MVLGNDPWPQALAHCRGGDPSTHLALRVPLEPDPYGRAVPHVEKPRGWGAIPAPDATTTIAAPSCSAEVSITEWG